ncbi:hypothetical protein AB0L06_36570 [Spirillospora sp. NPDC052269]
MTTPPMQPPTPGNGPVTCPMLRGFFVLGRCGRPAADVCPSCGRRVCREHLGSDRLCVECSRRVNDDVYEPTWMNDYRSAHHRHMSTVYGGDTWYSSFDGDDRDAFEPGGGDWAAASGDFEGDDLDGDAGGDWDSGDDGLVDS